MTMVQQPAAAAPKIAAVKAIKTNALGLDKTAYKGRESTLCNGCGHDSISARIINAAWELGLDQQNIVKMSGIGCSSKTPASSEARALFKPILVNSKLRTDSRRQLRVNNADSRPRFKRARAGAHGAER